MVFTRNYWLALAAVIMGSLTAFAQPPDSLPRQAVRTVSIPIAIFTKQELKENRLEEIVQADRLIVKAVSYTHLDVYKRQMLKRSQKL